MCTFFIDIIWEIPSSYHFNYQDYITKFTCYSVILLSLLKYNPHLGIIFISSHSFDSMYLFFVLYLIPNSCSHFGVNTKIEAQNSVNVLSWKVCKSFICDSAVEGMPTIVVKVLRLRLCVCRVCLYRLVKNIINMLLFVLFCYIF